MLSKTDGSDAVMAKTQNVDMFFTELLERCSGVSLTYGVEGEVT
jgi:hypothetical protein